MRLLGTALIVVGSFLGAYLLVLDVREVEWPPFLVALAVGAIGVVLRRRAMRSAVTDPGRPQESLGRLLEILELIAERTAQLEQAAPALGVYALPGRIDGDLRPQIEVFVSAREEIADLLGLRVYAEVLSAFSAGERYLNRVWSASIDGYIDEATRSLDRSRGHFDEAVELLRSEVEKGAQSS